MVIIIKFALAFDKFATLYCTISQSKIKDFCQLPLHKGAFRGVKYLKDKLKFGCNGRRDQRVNAAVSRQMDCRWSFSQ